MTDAAASVRKLPLYSEFFNEAAADKRAHTVTVSEHLHLSTRPNGDGLLSSPRCAIPYRKLELRLKGVADGTAAKVCSGLSNAVPPSTARARLPLDDETVFVRDGVMMLPKYHDSMSFWSGCRNFALNVNMPRRGDSSARLR